MESIVVQLLLVFTTIVYSSTIRETQLQPTCSSPVYCYGPLLHTVQTAEPKLFKDSKTFVDMRMIHSQSETLDTFNKLMEKTEGKPSHEELKQFVNKNFESGNELENATLSDWKENPKFLEKIKDPVLRQFASDLNQIWPGLARQIRPHVIENPTQYSIEPVPNKFVVPGGRFMEPYYWDSYWIISGLLICEMPDTARGVIENFLWFVEKYGFVPNGGRVYYAERSQPPLLASMVDLYIKYTNDTKWLKDNIDTLEKELKYWLNVHTVDVNGNTLLRYYAPSAGPRPESYREDLETAKGNQALYTELKSGAESGWDFSSRWFADTDGSLNSIQVTNIVPVDLNAFYCGAVEHISNFYSILGNDKKSAEWKNIRDEFRESIYKVLWSEEDGIWFDVNITTGEKRKQFYPSNVSPLWTKCIGQNQNMVEVGDRVAKYVSQSDMFYYPGGIPTSSNRAGEQWDFPNAWPPLQGIMVEGLANSESQMAQQLSFNLTERWVRSNLRGFRDTNEMFEKYDCEVPGRYGGGGEYVVQSGFGWTNGVILEMLNAHGDELTADED
ncbi:trehalase-like isoform X2 [Chrysoperla carnea]|uniref:trehalase-like isoform X2 n=1 Tax=Chrysoperla carnea TaxID=189513 RepID=UPI001D080BA6|nr:trehalase-like isoform X2 [Chrysoperla carnea]